MRKRYSRSYTVLSFLAMFSYRELPFVRLPKIICGCQAACFTGGFDR